MALKIKSSIVVEKIEDENGNVLGEIKFNPGDQMIMKKLGDIIDTLTIGLNEIKELKGLNQEDIKNLDKKLISVNDFEKASETINSLTKGIKIESDTVIKSIDSLKEVFGEETINIITEGIYDIEKILPLIEFLVPYIKENREKKLGKYIVNENAQTILE